MYLVDSHCHLDLLELTEASGDLNAVLRKAQLEGVQHILNVSVTLADFPTVLKTAEAYPFVSASVGLHPNEQGEETTIEQLIEFGKHKKVVAIGETGLDYFRTTGDVEWQRKRFSIHIEAAKTLQKPLIVHSRQAKEDTLQWLRNENASEVGGVIHCFTEDLDMAKRAIDLGFYISFSGIVTFKNATSIQEAAKHIPLERMLIETDAPYLAPNPHRGKSNEPGYVRHTAAFIAQMRDIPLEVLAEQTTTNFFTLFKGAVKSYV